MLLKFQAIGNLTADPIVKTVTVRGEEREVTEFSIAVNDPFDKDAEPSFINNIAAWNGQGRNVAKFCSKGSRVYIDGDFVLRRDEKDGVKRTHLNVKRLGEVRFLSSNGSSDEGRYADAPPSETEMAGATPAAESTPVEAPTAATPAEMEIPF